MCEYIDNQGSFEERLFFNSEQPRDVGGLTFEALDHVEGHHWECWHPETDGWETMLPPPEGMALEMSEGSQLRLVEGTPEVAPTNPNVIAAGTKMRDLLPEESVVRVK